MLLVKGVGCMKFKKMFFCVVSLIFSIIISGPNSMIANAVKPSKEEGISCRSKPVNDNIVCFETIDYSPEKSIKHTSGKITYRKKIIVKREYKKTDSLEVLADCTVVFTFKYDKKSYVKCEFTMPGKNKGEYYLKPLVEILPEKTISTGSIKYNLYQKNILGVYDYILDAHIDIFCSSMGDLGINSSMFY